MCGGRQFKMNRNMKNILFKSSVFIGMLIILPFVKSTTTRLYMTIFTLSLYIIIDIILIIIYKKKK